MILKGLQRAGGRQLAMHLLRADENEHVEVHEIRDFMADDLHGAFQEAYAASKGTRAKQFLFSLSLNPPPNERVPIETFESAIEAAEQRLGLDGQPRTIIFHEKDGRRHAHAVWSRIDTQNMRAINREQSRPAKPGVVRPQRASAERGAVLANLPPEGSP